MGRKSSLQNYATKLLGNYFCDDLLSEGKAQVLVREHGCPRAFMVLLCVINLCCPKTTDTGTSACYMGCPVRHSHSRLQSSERAKAAEKTSFRKVILQKVFVGEALKTNRQAGILSYQSETVAYRICTWSVSEKLVNCPIRSLNVPPLTHPIWQKPRCGQQRTKGEQLTC